MTTPMPRKPVLVVGATGNLGSRVVDHLLSRGKRVRALVRPGTDASDLQERGVEIVRGDMTKPETLPAALDGVDAVVTSAIGYSQRKPQDSIDAVDIGGNRNLVDAAKQANVRRFVFTSILTCDQAPDVPHFWAKKLTEDHLEASGVPFVALRPGAYMGGGPWWEQSLAEGTLPTFGPPDVAWTYVHPDDVAAFLAEAVDKPGIDGKRIDIGTDRPVTLRELARIMSQKLGRDIKIADSGQAPQRWGSGNDDAKAQERARDMMAMIQYFGSGKYVADTREQQHVFGRVPTIESTVERVVANLPKQAKQPART